MGAHLKIGLKSKQPVNRASLLLASALSPFLFMAVQTVAYAQSAPGTAIFADDWGQFGEKMKPSGPPKNLDKSQYTFQAGDFLVRGGANVGAVYNDNLFGTNTGAIGAWGIGLAPAVVAERNVGIYKTTLYGALNADLYDGYSEANTVTGRGGIIQLWEIQRDLTARAQLDYFRGVYYPGGAPSATPATNNFSDPQGYNTYFGSAGIHKDFGAVFVDLGGALSYTDYSDPSATGGYTYNLTSADGAIYTLTGRVGYNISPVIYVFAEPRVNWWQYTNSDFDSTGYRVVGGIGTDRISLFRGEIYAGYQGQNFDNAFIGDVTSPVLGAAISWFPTRDMTFKLTADQTFAVSTPSLVFSTPNVGVYNSYVTKNTTIAVTGDYTINRQWSANAGFNYTHADYVDQPRLDNIYAATAGVTYMMVTNWGISLAYTYTNQDSNIATDSYVQNIMRISARGQF